MVCGVYVTCMNVKFIKNAMLQTPVGCCDHVLIRALWMQVLINQVMGLGLPLPLSLHKSQVSMKAPCL